MFDTEWTVGAELRIPPKWAIAMLATSGLLLVALAEFWFDPSDQYRALLLGLLLYSGSAAAWLLANRAPRLSGWCVVLVSIAVIYLGILWTGMPGFLSLAPIPVIFAVALSGFPSALIVTVGETALVLLVPGFRAAQGGQPAATGITVAALWLALGAMVALYRPVASLGNWYEDYLQRFQLVVDEARDRRAELEQTMDSLAQANRQLALANARIAMLRDIAEGAQRAKTTFVANVSHEFRTPLNMIIGLVDLMMRSPGMYDVVLSPKMRGDLEVVHRNCSHLAHMVNDVLDLSRTEAGRFNLRRSPTDLGRLVRESVAAVQPLLQERGLTLEIALPARVPEVSCDYTRIQQVILNLLSNSARFTEAGGVTIGITVGEGRVLVRVSDTGSGIAEEDVERIFEPFWQGSTHARPAQNGSGLGLCISRELVRLHGGQMWAESQVGHGTTFCFTLPLQLAPETTVQPGRLIKQDWEWRESRFRTDLLVPTEWLMRPRVVVWDEGGALRDYLAGCGDQIEFVDVHNVTQLAHALQDCPAHAVMVNAGRPEGLWPLVKAVRQETGVTPVLGCSLPGHIQRGAELGVVGYLVKPILLADLERAIRSLDRPIRRVLVVDDDTDALQLFSRMLYLYDETLEVITASGGTEALEMLRQTAPDLMLLDIMMPDMDGWQVLDWVAEGGLNRVPTLLISAQDPAEEPAVSEIVLASVRSGLSVSQVLRCSLALSRFLVAPEGEPRPALG